MSKITLFRTSQYVNGMREYDIYLDGEKINAISNGETKTIEVSDGNHEIYLKIDWCKSKKLNINLDEGQELKLKCGSKVTGIKQIFALFYIFSSGSWVYLDYLAEGEELYTDNKEIKTWNEIKDMGLKKFILKYGVLRFGIPAGFMYCLLTLLFDFKKYSFHEGLILLLINFLLFSLIGGLIFGCTMWKIFKYKKD